MIRMESEWMQERRMRSYAGDHIGSGHGQAFERIDS